MVSIQNINLTSLNNVKTNDRCQELGRRTWREKFRERQAFLTFNKVMKILPKIIGTGKRHACLVFNVKTVTTRRTKNDNILPPGE